MTGVALVQARALAAAPAQAQRRTPSAAPVQAQMRTLAAAPMQSQMWTQMWTPTVAPVQAPAPVVKGAQGLAQEQVQGRLCASAAYYCSRTSRLPLLQMPTNPHRTA
jgi:hypothetical protein